MTDTSRALTTNPDRVRIVNDRPPSPDRHYVLYWMTAARRPTWNHGLDRAADLAREHGVGLVVLEALRIGYRWASPRFHQFIIEGMVANAAAFSEGAVTYYPYVESAPGEGKGLLGALAEHAVAVVTDDFPAFFLPRMLEAAGQRVGVKLEAVDGNGLMPMRAVPKAFSRAYDFRRYLQRSLPEHLDDLPDSESPSGLPPVDRSLLDGIRARWPELDVTKPVASLVAETPVAGAVAAVGTPGGHSTGSMRLHEFVDGRLSGYLERNHPDDDPSSRLSPYLHFGHVGSHQVVAAVMDAEGWHLGRLGDRRDGGREGWWGMSPPAEGYLDQLVTWRELGFNMCSHDRDFESYDSLPDWAQRTLDDHRGDQRPWLYPMDALEGAETHDEIWNAAQRELLVEGRIHNYLRMLWGKKILEWSASPEEALDRMIHLNNKYALDGRDPNSYSGIFWVLGKFDRAWGPERAIYGKVRYMTSDSTRRKLRLRGYLERYGA